MDYERGSDARISTQLMSKNKELGRIELWQQESRSGYDTQEPHTCRGADLSVRVTFVSLSARFQ
jgi:hypothetical protein